MLDFIYRLNDSLPTWHQNSEITPRDISAATDTSLPHVMQFLTEGTGKELEVSQTLSLEELTAALLSLSRKMRPEIEARETQLAKEREEALGSYNAMIEKVSQLEIAKDWRASFRSLTYFAGQYEEVLPRDILINVCTGAIRAGFKASISTPELGQWLQKSIAIAMSYRTKEGLEEAFDILDAYCDDFKQDPSGKGKQILGNIFSVLEASAAHFELWEEYKSLLENVYPASESETT